MAKLSPLNPTERLVDLSPLGKTIDPYHLFIQLVPQMTDQIRMLRHARATEVGNEIWHSYRGFPVVAAGFAVNGSDSTSVIINTGNLKASRAKEKVCAEKRMLGRLPKKGMTQLAGIIVASTTNEREIADIIGSPHATLLPCEDCTHLMEHDGHVSPDMPIVTVGLDEDIFQTTTPKELSAFYSCHALPPLGTTPVNGMDKWWAHRVALYGNWAAQRNEDPRGQPSDALLARVAIGIQPEAVLDAFRVPSWEAPAYLTALS